MSDGLGDGTPEGGHASAYSTGGGGVVLEHAYGGALLADLLLGASVTGLGDDVTPVRVGFQQSAHSPVDDLMVTGEGPGGKRTLFIGVRRKPVIGAGSKPFVKLMVDYLRVVSEHRAELKAGSWRLGLAVAAPHTPADEIAALARFARDQPEAGLFRAAVDAPSATTGRVRARLRNVDGVVAAAVQEAGKAGVVLGREGAGGDLSWLLLRYIRVLDLRLEGDDAAGRTSLVARLMPLAGDAAAADDLRRRLWELSAGYAVGSAVVDQEMLRRDLSATNPVAASPAYRASWDVLESLEDSLNSRTPRILAARRPGTAAGPRQFTVDRASVHAALVDAGADLLFTLTEAYYVEDPEVSGWGLPGRGIRRHKHTHAGFGHSFADWRYGPFWRLLPADPPRALALINRMLDHAVTCCLGPGRRAGHPSGQPGGGEPGGGVLPGIQLDIPGIGSRHYAGDGQVWGWYRGTGTGPYPCMSALLAVERIADEWLRQGTPLPTLVRALLRDAHNLAMPGLVAGVLTRHAEQVAGEAAPFLASPDVWELESARAVMETGIHAQLRDDPETPGSGRRSWTMADLAGCLVFSAVNRGDRERADALRAAGSTLAASAAEAAGRAADREDGVPDGGPGPGAAGTGQGGELTVVARLWASRLDASNYTASRDDDGNIAWEWQTPSDIEAAMAPDRSEQQRRGEVYRLVNAYSLRPDPPCLWAPPPAPATDVLAADARAARSLAGQPPGTGAAPFEAATAVAAVLLRAAAGQPGQAARDDLEWAAVTVAGALTRPLGAPRASGGSVFADGADLSAASAAALLLMPALTEPAGEPALLDEEDVAAVAEILAGAAASPFTRVRMILARNLGPVWAAPCGPGPGGGERCRHVIAWAAVEAGAQDVAMDPWDDEGRRGRKRLNGPRAEALAACPAGDLMLDLLAPPLVAACGAAAGSNCISPAARELRDALLGAYTRTAVVWGEENYDSPDEDQYAVAESLLTAGTQEPGLLTTAVSALAGQARALSETLRAMTVAATYSARARVSLARAWPDIIPRARGPPPGTQTAARHLCVPLRQGHGGSPRAAANRPGAGK